MGIKFLGTKQWADKVASMLTPDAFNHSLLKLCPRLQVAYARYNHLFKCSLEHNLAFLFLLQLLDYKLNTMNMALPLFWKHMDKAVNIIASSDQPIGLFITAFRTLPVQPRYDYPNVFDEVCTVINFVFSGRGLVHTGDHHRIRIMLRNVAKYDSFQPTNKQVVVWRSRLPVYSGDYFIIEWGLQFSSHFLHDGAVIVDNKE